MNENLPWLKLNHKSDKVNNIWLKRHKLGEKRVSELRNCLWNMWTKEPISCFRRGKNASLRSKTYPPTFFLHPLPLNNSTQLTCNSHRFSSQGLKPISLVFSQSLWLNLQQPSNPLIHPPKMTMTDLAAKQSICISLSLFFFGCTKYHEKVSVVIVPQQWNNRVIRQSAFDLGGQLIHLPIYLNYFLWNGYKRETVRFIHSAMTIPFFIHCTHFYFLPDVAVARFVRFLKQNQQQYGVLHKLVGGEVRIIIICLRRHHKVVSPNVKKSRFNRKQRL